jgi:hypothetical protein
MSGTTSSNIFGREHTEMDDQVIQRDGTVTVFDQRVKLEKMMTGKAIKRGMVVHLLHVKETRQYLIERYGEEYVEWSIEGHWHGQWEGSIHPDGTVTVS